MYVYEHNTYYSKFRVVHQLPVALIATTQSSRGLIHSGRGMNHPRILDIFGTHRQNLSYLILSIQDNKFIW